MLGPLRSSAITVWSEALPHADVLWVMGTLAMLVWEEQAADPLFVFNRATRIPRLTWFSRESVESVDMICAFEKLRSAR